MLWHSFAAGGAYYVMYDQPWCDWYFGGSGTLLNGFENMPFTPMYELNYYWGLFILGHPIQQTFNHFFIVERTPDFAEMSLHHIAHVSVSASYLMANVHS